MHFGEFNPLEVLAAAAVQHSGNNGESSSAQNHVEAKVECTEGEDEEDGEEEEEEDKRNDKIQDMVAPVPSTTASDTIFNAKPLALQSPLVAASLASATHVTSKPSIIKVLPSTSNGASKGALVSTGKKESTKIVIPTKDGRPSKTLTVLKMNSAKVNSPAEHTYAYLVDKQSKLDDDEGYCSRSSLDSPGQSSRSDSDAFEQESEAPTTPSAVAVRSGPRVLPMSPPPPPPRVISPRPCTVYVTSSAPPVSSGSSVTHVVTATSIASTNKKQPQQQQQKILVVGGKAVITSCSSSSSSFSVTGDSSSTTSSSGTSAVLRSLLGQQPIVSVAASASTTQVTSAATMVQSTVQQSTQGTANNTVTDISEVSASSSQDEKVPDNQIAEVAVKEESKEPQDEEIIDVTSCEATEPPPATVTKPAPKANIAQIKTAKPATLQDVSKRVPLLINTSIGGHKVTGPVTYLLVPPPSPAAKRGTVAPFVLSPLPGRAKNQYIIQDDAPPSCPAAKLLPQTVKPGIKPGMKQGKAVTLLSKSSSPAKGGTLLCIDANTGRPVQFPHHLTLSAAASSSSIISSASSSSSLSLSSQPIISSSSTLQALESPLLTTAPQPIHPWTSSSSSSSETSTALTSVVKIQSASVSKVQQLQEGNTTSLLNLKTTSGDDASSPAMLLTTPQTKKATTSIGNIGSLSLTKLDSGALSPRTVSPLSRTVSPLSTASIGSFSPIGSSRSHTPLSMEQGVSLFGGHVTAVGSSTAGEELTGPLPSHSKASARTSCHTYVKRKQSQASGIAGDMRLHPLIDHDYCMFTEFSADIQSSIIATTESKLKTERKYSKKTKAARTKVLRSPPPEKVTGRKKRKYTRRIPLEKLRQQRSADALLSLPSPSSSMDSPAELSPHAASCSDLPPSPLTPNMKPDSPLLPSKSSLDKTPAKPKTPTKRREGSGRNYVKITGSYQDEFVYFATKKTSGRPRKYHDSVVNGASTESMTGPFPDQLPTPATVAGINVFDWYRDLSNTDKSSRFGMEVDEEKLAPPNSDSLLTGRTPEHDSEVVDLVMEMANDNTVYTESTIETFNSFVDTNSIQSETVITTPSDEVKELPTDDNPCTPLGDSLGSEDQSDDTPKSCDSTVIKTENDAGGSDVTSSNAAVKDKDLDTDTGENTESSSSLDTCQIDDAMVEQVRTMLSSMGEAELKMLSENLSTEAHKDTNGPDNAGLNAFLTSYTPDCVPSQTSSSTFDLDDIADSDLLPMSITEPILPLSAEELNKADQKNAELSKMKGSSTLNMLFAEPGSQSESPLKQFSVEDMVNASRQEGDNFSSKLDRSELFPDISHSASASPHPNTSGSAAASSGTPSAQVIHASGNSAPPELTVVSMYWNDLPGLMLNGKQHVRLVDIHKQMLPAKDTGILKKRCQMMSLEIINCTELQRDFLIRYANAAKSKSTVVVTKEDAQTLVSFYVDPRPRAPRHSVCEDSMDNDTVYGSFHQRSESGKVKLKIKLKNEQQQQHPTPALLAGAEQQREAAARSKQTTSRKRQPTTSAITLQDKNNGRTRNKKVNYAALHSGGNDESEKLPPPPTTAAASVYGTQLPVTPRLTFPEEREIRRLRNKQKKRPLIRKDREKLKRLRDKLRRKLRKLRNEMDKVRSGVEKKCVQSDGVMIVEPLVGEVKAVVHVDSSPVLVEDVAATEFIEVVSPGPPAQLLAEPEVVPIPEEIVLQIQGAETEMEEQKEIKEEEVDNDEEEDADVEEPEHEREMPAILVHHRDNTSRSQRGRWQEGYLKFSLYSSKDAPCITCATCREVLTVKKFIKHLHHQNKADELCQVSLAQKLEPKCPAPMLTWQIWEQFEKRQKEFEAAAVKERQQQKQQKQLGNVKTLEGEEEKSTELNVKTEVVVEDDDDLDSVKDIQESSTLKQDIKPLPNITNVTNQPQQRQSRRVRKRKQLHPMESYVYGAAQNKRVCRSGTSETDTQLAGSQEEKLRG